MSEVDGNRIGQPVRCVNSAKEYRKPQKLPSIKQTKIHPSLDHLNENESMPNEDSKSSTIPCKSGEPDLTDNEIIIKSFDGDTEEITNAFDVEDLKLLDLNKNGNHITTHAADTETKFDGSSTMHNLDDCRKDMEVMSKQHCNHIANGVTKLSNCELHRRTNRHQSNTNSFSVHLGQRPSEVEDKLTPIGRLIVPLSVQNGIAPVGLNSIFMSPERTNSVTLQVPLPEKTRQPIEDRVRAWLIPSDSPVNIKLFGGERGVRKEQLRTKRAGWVIHPCSALRHYWDFIMLLLLILNMIILPVAITFFKEDMSNDWAAFNIISDIVFVLDIILNFRTGYMSQGTSNQFILEPKLIAKRYLKSWFALDLISSLPFDYLVSLATGESATYGLGLKSASRALKFLRLAKLLSLLRLLRISRLLRYFSQYEELFHLTSSFVRYIKLVSMMLMVAHWNGCLGFLVPMLQGFPSDCWVAINSLQDSPWFTQYSWALFKALSHMLCIGYGRFPPANLSEAYITTFSMITGATFYALFIAHSMAFLQQVDSARRQYGEKFKQIEEYMAYRHLPDDIRERISDYYEHRYQGKLFNEQEILTEISRPLKEEIVNHNCRDLVDSVPFFKDGDREFVTKVLTKLEFEVYLPGDIIITEGTVGTEMFFIRQGTVDIMVNSHVITSLSEGSYFGEICLLTNARRVASVRAATMCDLFVLSADNFKTVLDEHPEVRILIEHVAVERLMNIGKEVPAARYYGDGAIEDNNSIPDFTKADQACQTSSISLNKLGRKSKYSSTNLAEQCSEINLDELIHMHKRSSDRCKLCRDSQTTVQNLS